MSQWTHFLGVIRYDSINKVVYPEPPNKNKLVEVENKFILNAWNSNVPGGSEGPLELNSKVTNRGPTITVTGDLRDFGLGELDSVVKWVDERANFVVKQSMENKCLVMLRDIIIYCDVEYNGRYVITDKEGPFGEGDLRHDFQLVKIGKGEIR